MSKATKKRSKENAFRTRARKLTQRAVSAFLAPQKHGARQNHRCLNPSFSRILTRTRFAPYALGQARLPRNPHGPTRICSLGALWVSCSVGMTGGVIFVGRALSIRAALFQGGLATWFGTSSYLVDGCPRIARDEPWAGSITGGEACGYRCSEKEGFTHPWLLRAPCFWGAKNVETAR